MCGWKRRMSSNSPEASRLATIALAQVSHAALAGCLAEPMRAERSDRIFCVFVLPSRHSVDVVLVVAIIVAVALAIAIAVAVAAVVGVVIVDVGR